MKIWPCYRYLPLCLLPPYFVCFGNIGKIGLECLSSPLREQTVKGPQRDLARWWRRGEGKNETGLDVQLPQRREGR